EAQKIIIDGVAAGVPRHFAAERAGVDDSTVRRWAIRGRREKSGIYCTFLTALKKAEADAVAACVARIRRAAQGGQLVERTTTTTTRKDGSSTTKTVEKVAPGQWTADAWWLERRHPDEFAGNRREVRELREQLAALIKLVGDGKLGATTPAAS